MDEDAIDFVIAAWREDGQWNVSRLPKRSGLELSSLIAALSSNPADTGALGMIAVNEDFFVIARVDGHSKARLLLSDITAAADWDLAEDVLEYLGLPEPDEDDLEDIEPAGDLALLAGMGMSGAELSVLIDDVEMYPDEVLSAVATKLGFGERFETLLDQSS